MVRRKQFYSFTFQILCLGNPADVLDAVVNTRFSIVDRRLQLDPYWRHSFVWIPTAILVRIGHILQESQFESSTFKNNLPILWFSCSLSCAYYEWETVEEVNSLDKNSSQFLLMLNAPKLDEFSTLNDPTLTALIYVFRYSLPMLADWIVAGWLLTNWYVDSKNLHRIREISLGGQLFGNMVWWEEKNRVYSILLIYLGHTSPSATA